MYISLETCEVWHISGGRPCDFFMALTKIIEPVDVMVLGCYNPQADFLEWLSDRQHLFPHKPYQDNFDLNRSEYPNGDGFSLLATEFNLSALAKFVGRGKSFGILFDHFLAYRVGCPLLPLINFHDAGSGGELYLSGHYAALCVEGFCNVFGGTGNRVRNPEW